LDDAVADSDHDAMVAAAREHYVDDCESLHGITVIPAVRSAILEGTPVAVSEIRRLSLNRDTSSPAVARRQSLAPLKSSPSPVIPMQRGLVHAIFEFKMVHCHTFLQLHEDANSWALQNVVPIFLLRRKGYVDCLLQRARIGTTAHCALARRYGC
jgi:hypothetical protein